MNVCCVVAEYNPLHLGHEYQLKAARELSKADYVIAVMSGSFVQRGEPAAYPKHHRAAWALSAGADLVIDLPTAYSLQSAENFCFGGVATLSALGLMTHLSFGTECADTELLSLAASLGGSPEHNALVKEGLKQGKSYAASLQGAYRVSAEGAAEMLNKPNFLLGVSYMRAVKKCCPNTSIVPVARRGAAHDSAELDGGFSSASSFRAALSLGGDDARRAADRLPNYVADDIVDMAPASLDKLSTAILYTLRTADAVSLQSVFGVDEGLEQVLLRAGRRGTLFEALDKLKTKRYTMARLRRTLCAVLLGFTKELCRSANSAVPYIRVLGARKESLALLGMLSRTAKAPVLYKKSDFEQLDNDAAALLALDVRATDIAALCFGAPAGADLTSPFIIK